MNEIWNNILKADKKRQIIGKIRDNEQKINELPTKCGSCDLWMTSQCEREKATKVSDGMSICSKYKQQKWVTDLICNLQVEVSELRSSLNGL